MENKVQMKVYPGYYVQELRTQESGFIHSAFGTVIKIEECESYKMVVIQPRTGLTQSFFVDEVIYCNREVDIDTAVNELSAL